MLRSSLCDYSDAYIHAGAIITVSNTAAVVDPNNRKNIIIENCAPFTNCISEINNTQINNPNDIDIVMPIVIIILDVYGITTEINLFKTIMVLLMIFLLIIMTVLHLNSKQKWWAEQEMMVQKSLKLEYH